MLNPSAALVPVPIAGVLYLHSLNPAFMGGKFTFQMRRDNCSLFVTSVGMGMNRRLIQLSITWSGMTLWCCLRCLASSNSCPINLHQSRQAESEKWRRPACANINPKFPASIPSWPWFGMTSICWLAAHISLQIVWARLICFYARLVQNVMPRYLLGALPMWCRVPSDRQGEKKGDWGWLSRCLCWYMKREAHWTHPGTVSQQIGVLLGEAKVEYYHRCSEINNGL